MRKFDSMVSRAVWVLVSLSLFSGCGSMQKSANEKLENGEYDGAMSLYERILKNDPTNVEAQEGLKRARGGVLSDRLIQVRKARESGNSAQAMELLLQVVTLEKQWNTYPPAAAHFTQDEETNFAWAPFSNRIGQLLTTKQPLAADWTWNRFQPVFAGSKHASALQGMRPAIQRGGKDHCATLAHDRSSATPFYADFIGRYCRYWKASAKTASGAERARAAQLVSGLDWQGKMENLPAEYNGIFKKDFEEALKSSAWYDPAGTKKIEVQMSGAYSFSHTKNLVSRVKEYNVDEPYQDVETVTKTRMVPHQVSKYVNDPVSGQSKLVNTVEQRPESYAEQQVVTKSRSVTHQFPYSALFHQQAIEMNESVIATVGGSSVTMAESNQSTAEGDEQNITNSKVGLTPSRPALINPANWVGGESQKLKGQFAKKLQEEWLSQICAQSGAEGAAALADRVQKCKRDSAGATSPFVNEWYTKTFGLAQADAEGMLGAAVAKR